MDHMKNKIKMVNFFINLIKNNKIQIIIFNQTFLKLNLLMMNYKKIRYHLKFIN